MASSSSLPRHRQPPPQNVSDTFRMPPCEGLELFEITVEELQQLFGNAKLTSEAYVRHCIDRVHQIDQYLESVIELNPDAVAIARTLDEERQQGRVRGKLHGIPILVKDNMATKDRMQTTAGSWALLGSKVPRDAHVVSRLREAGAVILGHANMSEWASVRSSSYSTGYSPRGGQTRNCFDLSKSPRGSSSGSAVAVSANIVPLALGTETDTSVIGPAMVAGVVGIKPTVGLTSRAGVVPISNNLDTVGSFGRTVADAVYVLDAIAGDDPRDPATSTAPAARESIISYLSSKETLKGAVFGLPINRCWGMVPPAQKAVASEVLEAIKEAGAEILPTDFPSAEERIPVDGQWDWDHGPPERSEFTVVKADAYNGINEYLSQLTDTPVRTVEDVVRYNEENTGTEGAHPGDHPAFPPGQDNLKRVLCCKGMQDETYDAALAWIRRQSREEGIDAALKSRRGEEVVAVNCLFFCDVKGVGQQMAAQAGYPIISVPIGVDDDGMPVSLSLQHTAWQEAELVRWASAVEDLVFNLRGWRPLPKYQNHLSKNLYV